MIQLIYVKKFSVKPTPFFIRDTIRVNAIDFAYDGIALLNKIIFFGFVILYAGDKKL
jgi:hypothetical protein